MFRILKVNLYANFEPPIKTSLKNMTSF